MEDKQANPQPAPQQDPAAQVPDAASEARPADTGESALMETQAELGEVQAKLAEAEAKLAALQEDFLRAKAETENIRRRAQEDVAKAHKFALESFAEYLLPVIDSLEAALADTSGDAVKVREGIELTLRQLTSALEKGRVIPINPVGEKFDPHRHQAISMVPSEQEA